MPAPSLDLWGPDLRTTEDEDDLSSSIHSDALSRFMKPSSRSWEWDRKIWSFCYDLANEPRPMAESY